MIAKIYNSYKIWNTEIDKVSQTQLDSIESIVKTEQSIQKSISFLSGGRLDTVNTNRNRHIQAALTNFLYENQMAISFKETPLLRELMNGYDPRYAHSQSFFEERLGGHLWFEYTLTFLQKETEETRYILNSLLEIYSEWDGEYQCESLYANKIFRRIYRFQMTEEYGTFKNKLGDSCKTEDVLTGLVFYQENGIGNGLYRSSFYNVFLFYVLYSVFLELRAVTDL